MGFAEIIRIVITNATSVTNGSLGIKGIPQNATLWWNYSWLVFTVTFIILLLRSNTGNVLRAIRDDEIAAKTMGINAFFYRSFSFTAGAFFAGVGGALMAALISTIDPKMFNFLLTFNILMIVVAGGLGSITGSIIGSIIITVMLEWLRIIESPFDLGFIHIPETPGLRMVIFLFYCSSLSYFGEEVYWDNVNSHGAGFIAFLHAKSSLILRKSYERHYSFTQ